MGLIINEWVKIFKRKATIIMLGLLVLLVLGGAITLNIFNKDDAKPNSNWKTELKAENKQLEEDMKSVPGDSAKNYMKKSIAENDYRIEHNLPEDHYTVWSFMDDMQGVISLVALFTIIIAAGIVANEFSWGTIKLLMIRPISRVKILMSKYAAVIVYALLNLVVLFVLSLIFGAIFFGFGDTSPYLAYTDGHIVERNQIMHLIGAYGISSISMLMYTTMAFMISAAFRNSSLAIGVSIFLLLSGASITNLLAMKFDWAKYLLFANVDLTPYFDGNALIDGMTLSFSLVMLLIYFIIFHVVAFLTFVKRDIAA
ncbi:ABC-2 type transport system permease protein [Bacillus sp. OV322]|uniref:ABC transporter permease n=1 Tax=Bacillus sp. OV322 TaxID=1882764 RepID=UPI0008E64C03|nr:ABC-2 type transport system permease protein [Bacillus sp. OV322]